MILVIDMNWKRDSLGFNEFVAPILAVAEKMDDCVVKHYLEIRIQDICLSNRIILSGTALKDNFFLLEPNKFQWLKEIEKPILGICAGMEIIATVFGESLKESLEIGITQIKTVAANSLFSGDFKAYSLHNYCVDSSYAFEILAQSSKCVQAIKHRNRAVFGLLFHPEVRNPQILENFIFGQK
jgi:GMP synthase-like glutamine amidotransferase